MFKSIFKIAFRNIYNNKVFSLINIVGLSIGLSASLVIGITIYYDLTFDKFHPNGDRIYRITSTFSSNDGSFSTRGSAVPLGHKINEGVVGIDKATTFFSANFQKIAPASGNPAYKNIDDIILTDASYFDLFNYQWLAGSPVGILENPNEVVLTCARAEKYFPRQTSEEVLGQILVYNDSVQVKVVGVIENFQEQTDFDFQEFLSYKTSNDLGLKDQALVGNWNSTNSASQLFILIHDNNLLPQIQRELDHLAKEYEDRDMVSKGYIRKFNLQPLSDIHFNQDVGTFNHNPRTANINVLTSLACVALFLLLLGCFNFINLNTAQAAKRAKEIGIRKTLGSSKIQLVYQFILETTILTLAASIVSLFMSPVLIAIFTNFLPEGITAELFLNSTVIVSILILLVAVALTSGLYPALILSNFRPAKVLRNQILLGDSKPRVRKFLTVFQFTIAQILIIATLMVGKQLNYLLEKDMGFKTNAIVYIRTWDDENYQKRLNFVNELKAISQISNISLGGDPPASSNSNSDVVTFFNEGKEINTELQFLFGDNNYRKLYGIDLLGGRDRLNDTIEEYIINETYAKILGFSNPVDAVGQMIKRGDSLHQIVGVMPNFYQRSLSSNIAPMALIGDINTEFYRQFNTVHFSLESHSSENWPTIIEMVKTKFKTIYPDADFEVNFVDDTIAHFYDQERNTSVLLNWSAGLSILISCLGLFGLVIHTIERRIKEIGIRKVLGATVIQLNVLLCQEFLVLVGIAFIIATPLAWWGLHYWLEGYAYRANLSLWVFVMGALIMLFASLVIMSIQTLSTANKNPVDSLRME